MQFFVRLFITIVVVIVILVVVVPLIRFVWQTWNNPIDLKESVHRWFKSQSEIIVIRDPKKIYQNGKEVGNVTGQVEERNDDSIIFYELCETSELKRDHPFEYQNETLKITEVGHEVKFKIGTPNKNNVLENVVCKKLQ